MKSLVKEVEKIKPKVKYEFHKWKRQLSIVDLIIFIGFFLLLSFLRIDYVLLAAFIFIFPYAILTKRKLLFNHLLFAVIVAFIWVVVAAFLGAYEYNSNFLAVAGFNFLPFFAWTTGLFGVYIIYSHYEYRLKKHTYFRRLFLFFLFFIVVLIAFETIGYHVFNIQNTVKANYPGLPICDCIHAPRWMQTTYFLLGPIYFSLCYLFKLENPNVKIIKLFK